MSRSKSEGIQSPATKHFEWDATDGCIKYYDKEKKENIKLKLPFSFLVLDRLATIKGYSDADSSGIWSNAVKSTKKEPFVVRTKKGIVLKGLYENIKGELASMGGKYASQLWIAYYEGKDLKIATLTLFGAGGSTFIDFSKANDVFKNAIIIKNSTTGKKGKTVYEMPNFEVQKISEETDEIAKGLDATVQEYLSDYLSVHPTEEKTESYTQTSQVSQTNDGLGKGDIQGDSSDDLPF